MKSISLVSITFEHFIYFFNVFLQFKWFDSQRVNGHFKIFPGKENISMEEKSISPNSSVIEGNGTFYFRKKWQKLNLRNIFSPLTYKADIKT